MAFELRGFAEEIGQAVAGLIAEVP